MTSHLCVYTSRLCIVNSFLVSPLAVILMYIQACYPLLSPLFWALTPYWDAAGQTGRRVQQKTWRWATWGHSIPRVSDVCQSPAPAHSCLILGKDRMTGEWVGAESEVEGTKLTVEGKVSVMIWQFYDCSDLLLYIQTVLKNRQLCAQESLLSKQMGV